MENKLILPAIAEKVNLEQIVAFFDTALGKQSIRHHQTVRRGQLFFMLVEAEELIQNYPETTQDDLLIYGITDGYTESDNQCILYDYKTNHVKGISPQAISEIVERYRGQMNLYRRALQETTHKEVPHAYLILLNGGVITDMQIGNVVDFIKQKKLEAETLTLCKEYVILTEEVRKMEKVKTGSFVLCPKFEKSFSILGKKWSGLIIDVLLERGPQRFGELKEKIPMLGDCVLVEQLKELKVEGITAKAVRCGEGSRLEYSLTEKGEDL